MIPKISMGLKSPFLIAGGLFLAFTFSSFSFEGYVYVSATPNPLGLRRRDAPAPENTVVVNDADSYWSVSLSLVDGTRTLTYLLFFQPSRPKVSNSLLALEDLTITNPFPCLFLFSETHTPISETANGQEGRRRIVHRLHIRLLLNKA